MSFTYNELIHRMLYAMDAYEILEVLELSAEELLDRFEDKIIKDYEKIEEYLDNG
jgi:hypothetical protein